MPDKQEAPVEQRFPFTIESLQAELGHSHQYYLEAIKMTVRIPVVAASVFFALVAAYGFILRAGVEFARYPGSKAMGHLLETIMWVMPAAGIFISIVFTFAQFAAIEAMDFSADAYLTPNRIRLGLPRRQDVRHALRKKNVRTTLVILFFVGHGITCIIWAALLVRAICT